MATLLLYLNANDPASWTYTGTPPNPADWTNVSGVSLVNSNVGAISNTPTTVTEPTVKGIQMQATTGGTYPNGTLVGNKLQYPAGNPTTTDSLNNRLYYTYGMSYSISMWIKFNQAPISGSTPYSLDNLPTFVFSSPYFVYDGFGNGTIALCFGSNLGDSVSARNVNQFAARFYDGATSYTAGTWAPATGIWYNVAIVCERVSTYAGNLSLYVNGALNGTVSISGAAKPVFETYLGPPLNDIYLNYPPYGNTPERYGGDITYSTFQLWGGARTSEEIMAAFSSEAAAYGYAPVVVAPQERNPKVMLRWSDDGGHTWSNEHWASMGELGAYGTRVIWRRLGMTEKLRDRVYEVSGTDPVKISIVGAELLVSSTNG